MRMLYGGSSLFCNNLILCSRLVNLPIGFFWLASYAMAESDLSCSVEKR